MRMKLAASLGAETQTLTGNDLPAELLRFAKFENVTQIVVGRSRGGFLSELLRRSLPHELVRRTQDIAIHVVTRETDARRRRRLRRAASGRCKPLPFFYATLAVAAARRASASCSTVLTPIPNLSVVFLLAVLLSAVSFGIWPAIYASVLSFLAFNFFFIEPLYTFTIAEPYELLALLTFLIVAVVTSALAGRVRGAGQDLGEPDARDAAALRIHAPAFRRSRRSMRWPKARRARSMQALAARPS